MVVNALHIEEEKKGLRKYIQRLSDMGVRLLDSNDGGVVIWNMGESSLVVEIREKQNSDHILLKLKERVQA